MDWGCDITKTRPITLLDTLRKAVMKIITNRLSRIIAKHNILRGNKFCRNSESKKINDMIKLWREMNDGMDHVHRSCKPDKNEVGILGIQIAGEMMHLNILIKDIDNIHRLYHLFSLDI